MGLSMITYSSKIIWILNWKGEKKFIKSPYQLKSKLTHFRDSFRNCIWHKAMIQMVVNFTTWSDFVSHLNFNHFWTENELVFDQLLENRSTILIKAYYRYQCIRRSLALKMPIKENRSGIKILRNDP